MKYLKFLLQSKNTVFTISELKYLFGIKDSTHLNQILQRMKKQEILQNLWYGIWTFQDYDKLELASKLRGNSYISLEYVLQKQGIIFQSYEKTITLVSNNTFRKVLDDLTFEYHKIKPSILTNPLGVQYTGKYLIATPERAVCDMVYLYKNTVFDNLWGLDGELLRELSKIYPKTTALSLQKIIEQC